MVSALVAGPGARELASTLREAGFEAWSLDPATPVAARRLLVLVGLGEEAGTGDRSGPTSLGDYADLVPEAPFTEWRSLMFSLWTDHGR
ncbi:MAG TPA: hypothetical protein VGL92_12380 [Acidimicrobiia bacterium]|jgi:hypothetical protein